MEYASPLRWPAGWPRAADRKSSPFSVTLYQARTELAEELARLRARNAVLSSNGKLTKVGGLSADQARLADPGVALYYTDRDGNDRCVPCDRWADLAGNVRAIERTLNALRGIDRWGAKAMVDAAFAGFAALPPPQGEPWWEVLRLYPQATPAEIESAYRVLVKRVHPDAGGNPERFRELQAAYDEARRERR